MRRLRRAATVALAMVTGCAPAALRRVADDPGAPAASPPILAALENDPPVETAQDWTERRAPILREAAQASVYGRMPAPSEARVLSRTAVALPELTAFATVEQWDVAVTPGPDPMHFHLVLVTPKDAPGPLPLLVMENFCGNRAAFEGRPEPVAAPMTPVLYSCTHAVTDPIVHWVFGTHINGPPWETVMQAGYAVALFYPGDAIADDAAMAGAALARLTPPDAAAEERTGAIAAWAWLFSRALDVLGAVPRIDAARTAIWGHSRHGKSALLAAAFDARVEAVIAHQSGRGGASLSRSNAGESVAEITEAFPHWFGPRYATYAGREAELPFEQHQLLALIAPRPVLLGNGGNDAWSDPQAAFRAVQGADPVYRLFCADAFAQQTLREAPRMGKLVYFMREGRHGVTREDWRMFLSFLDAHLKPGVQP
jgi:hypothetical protein